MRVLGLALVLVLAGCSTVYVPDGPFLASVGQASAAYCACPVLPGEAPACITTEGGSLSEGFTGVLTGAIGLATGVFRAMNPF